MRGCSENRFLEYVFPVSCEFLFGDDASRDGVLTPTRPGENDLCADRGGCRAAERQQGRIERAQSLD